jgi:hypothetical protein
MLQQTPTRAVSTLLHDSVAGLAIEPLPFYGKSEESFDNTHYISDPFFQSVLQLLISMDDSGLEGVQQSGAWPQLPTIAITDNALHVMADAVVGTPDDQRNQPLSHMLAMSPSAMPRKRLRVDTLPDKEYGTRDDEEEYLFRKRHLTNSRRDAVTMLREEARALETTLKGLHLRQSRPKSDLVSDDPDALVKSYAENIQLKRAIEEQNARIKTLRRAVSAQETKVGSTDS